jgi:hypothetical protein
MSMATGSLQGSELQYYAMQAGSLDQGKGRGEGCRLLFRSAPNGPPERVNHRVF